MLAAFDGSSNLRLKFSHGKSRLVDEWLRRMSAHPEPVTILLGTHGPRSGAASRRDIAASLVDHGVIHERSGGW